MEMLQLCGGDTFAGMLCPLSGQSDSRNITEGLRARVHLAVSALVASLRAPQRMSPWRDLPGVLCPTYSFRLLPLNKYEGHTPSLTSKLATRFREYGC